MFEILKIHIQSTHYSYIYEQEAKKKKIISILSLPTLKQNTHTQRRH